jgi:predicted nucleic acid-binding Zn ribbon protein
VSTEFKSLQQLLKALIKTQKLDKVIERTEVIERFEEIVGEQIAKQVVVKNFDRGILTIEVESSVWKNEILLLRNQIIEKLNQQIGKEVVKQILIL